MEVWKQHKMYRSKEIKRIVGLLLFSFYLSSCLVKNLTRNNSENTCELHHEKMHKTTVKAQYGLQPYITDYKYPHSKHEMDMGCVLPAFPKPFVRIFYCKTCDKLEKENN